MSKSGFNVRRILQMAVDSNVLLPEHTMKNVRFIARYMEGCIYRQRDYRRRKNTLHLGFPPASYTGVDPFQYTQIPHISQAHQHHHHHHYHPQRPYSPPPSNAPPLYSNSTGIGTGGIQTSPDIRGPSNGGAIQMETMHTSQIKQQQQQQQQPKRSSQSWFQKLKANFSQQKRAAPGRPPYTDDEPGNPEAHPMMTWKKNGKHQGRCSSPADASYRTIPFNSIGDGSANESGSILCGKRSGNYLVVLYFIIKILYLLNIVGQMFMMEKFVGHNYTFYGLRVLIDLINGREWFHSGNFPRVTFCDFEAKKLGKNHM